MKFKTKIVQSGNNTGINVPAEIIEGFNAGKKPPVKIAINKYSYQSTVAVMGGKYMVSLSKAHREAAGVNGGDAVEINVELDDAPRTVEVPADFQKVLNKNAAAKKSYEALSASKKKNMVLLITEAKTEETRFKRIEKAIASLTPG
jgi:antitoxin component of MazEF toxin-antitoxin module